MKIQAKNKSIEVLLYEDIGGFWGIDSKTFVTQLKKAITDNKPNDINLRIDSNGGSVFDGVAIHNYLRSTTQRVNVYVDGLAASIASIIAMAGDTIHMADNAWMMIHDPWGMAIGTSEEMRTVADTMDGIRDTLLDTYMKRAKYKREKVSQMMSDETWLNAEDALDAGLVDEITGEMKVAAAVNPKWFKHPPQQLVARAQRQPDTTMKQAHERRAMQMRKLGINRKNVH